MSFEAITGITNAESEAKAQIAAAEARAKQMISDVRADGKAIVSAAISKAEAELVQLRLQSDEKAEAAGKSLLEELAQQKAVLKAQAESRMDKAAALIVERIVKS